MEEQDLYTGFAPNSVAIPAPSEDVSIVQSGEAAAGIKPGSRWETFGAQLRAGALDYPSGLPGTGEYGRIPRLISEFLIEDTLDQQGRAKIKASEANKRFPGMPVPFAEDIHPEIAELQYNTEQRRRYLHEYANSGPSSAGFELAAGIASGAVPGAALGALGGPLGAAIGGVVGGAIGGYTGPVGALQALDPAVVALTLATGGVTKALGLGNSLRATFAENVIGNVGTDIPSYIQGQRERQNESGFDVAVSSVGSALLGTAIHGAVSATIRGIESRRISRSEADARIKEEITRSELGSRPRTDVALRVATPEVERPGAAGYERRDYAHPSETIFHAALDRDTGQPILFNDFGEGIYGSDNPLVAKGFAGNGETQPFVVKRDAKIFDLDAPLPEGQASQVMAAVKAKIIEAVGPDRKIFNDLLKTDPSLSDILRWGSEHAGDEGIFQALSAVAKEQGIDGFKYVDQSDRTSVNTGYDNRVVVFDEKVLEPAQLPPPDEVPPVEPTRNPETVAREESLNSAGSPEESTFADSTLDEEIPKLKATPVDTVEDVDAYVKETDTVARDFLRKQAEADPTLANDVEYQKLAAQVTSDAKELSVSKMLAECMMGGGSGELS